MKRTGVLMTSVGDCVRCGTGVFCPVGSATATNCSAGTYNAVEAQEEWSLRLCDGILDES